MRYRVDCDGTVDVEGWCRREGGKEEKSSERCNDDPKKSSSLTWEIFRLPRNRANFVGSDGLRQLPPTLNSNPPLIFHLSPSSNTYPLRTFLKRGHIVKMDKLPSAEEMRGTFISHLGYSDITASIDYESFHPTCVSLLTPYFLLSLCLLLNFATSAAD